jgi:hypothetical protein
MTKGFYIFACSLALVAGWTTAKLAFRRAASGCNYVGPAGQRASRIWRATFRTRRRTALLGSAARAAGGAAGLEPRSAVDAEFSARAMLVPAGRQNIYAPSWAPPFVSKVIVFSGALAQGAQAFKPAGPLRFTYEGRALDRSVRFCILSRQSLGIALQRVVQRLGHAKEVVLAADHTPIRKPLREPGRLWRLSARHML